MNLFGVKVPVWALIVLGLVVLVLVGKFVWVTVVGSIAVVLKVALVLGVVALGLWLYKKFGRRS